MRTIALLSASLFTLVSATAAFADADLVVTGLAGGDWLTGPAESTSDAAGYALQGGASVQYDFTPVIGAQGDLVINFSDLQFDGTPISLERTSLDGAFHLYYRDDTFLVGAFGQLGITSLGFDTLGPSGVPDVNRAYIGAEGQLYIDNLTLYGQLGLMQYDFNGLESTSSLSGAFGTFEIRYFLTPNFKVAANAAVQTLDLPSESTGDSFTTYVIGASAEYKFDDMPFSIFGRIDFADQQVDGGEGNGLNETRALVGIKFAMGEETLLARDRSGVTLKPVELGAYGMPLPFFSPDRN